MRGRIPEYQASNRGYLTVAVGCTGGQHRSVYIVDRLAEIFAAEFAEVTARHSGLPGAKLFQPRPRSASAASAAPGARCPEGRSGRLRDSRRGHHLRQLLAVHEGDERAARLASHRGSQARSARACSRPRTSDSSPAARLTHRARRSRAAARAGRRASAQMWRAAISRGSTLGASIRVSMVRSPRVVSGAQRTSSFMRSSCSRSP